jgi:hypothetical protein
MVVNGRLDVDLSDALDKSSFTILNCTYCKDLEELPLLENIKEVKCTGCPKIRRLPTWPNVTKVDCSYCPNLEELPSWPNVIEVDCSYCPKLNKFPPWHLIKYINTIAVPSKWAIYMKYVKECKQILSSVISNDMVQVVFIKYMGEQTYRFSGFSPDNGFLEYYSKEIFHCFSKTLEESSLSEESLESLEESSLSLLESSDELSN